MYFNWHKCKIENNKLGLRVQLEKEKCQQVSQDTIIHCTHMSSLSKFHLTFYYFILFNNLNSSTTFIKYPYNKNRLSSFIFSRVFLIVLISPLNHNFYKFSFSLLNNDR
jgi:hypothetical protein